MWRNPPATVLLYGSLLVHFVLALVALYRRRTLVMPPREAAQVILGLLIPLLVAEHVVGTRLLHALYDVRDTYEYVVRALWIATPAVGVRQAIALVVIWAHGCLGLYFWLRYRRWYASAAPWLLIVAVLLPVLALLGFAHAGQTVVAMGPPTGDAIDPALFDEAVATKERIDRAVYLGFVAIVAAVLIARLVRDRIERLSLIEVDYPGGQTVRIPKGYSVLDASRLGGIPHYSVCGGRGRCSTCRVKVIEGLEGQPEAGQIEQATLAPHFGRGRRAARLPVQADRRRQGDAAAGAALRAGPACRHPLGGAWPRAGRRGAVLRHAQLHVASPTSGCRSTSCSCSTAISRSSARPSRRPAAASTSSSATGQWRCSAWKPRPAKQAARRSPRRAPSSPERRG